MRRRGGGGTESTPVCCLVFDGLVAFGCAVAAVFDGVGVKVRKERVFRSKNMDSFEEEGPVRREKSRWARACVLVALGSRSFRGRLSRFFFRLFSLSLSSLSLHISFFSLLVSAF